MRALLDSRHSQRRPLLRKSDDRKGSLCDTAVTVEGCQLLSIA
jgi:hypothetical protein